jgi:hypothetical protein
MHKWNKNSAIPPVITIFSAPNYCGTYGNKGAILRIEVHFSMIQEQRNEDKADKTARTLKTSVFDIRRLFLDFRRNIEKRQ